MVVILVVSAVTDVEAGTSPIYDRVGQSPDKTFVPHFNPRTSDRDFQNKTDYNYDPRAYETRPENATPSTDHFLVTANNRMQEVSRQSYIVTYILAGMGMLYLVIMAFMGRFNWKHSAAIIGGLAILAGFQYMVAFLS